MNYQEEHNLFEISCKVVIFDKQLRKIALIKYADEGKYGIPGGHLERGEVLEDAARREFFQETGDAYHGGLRQCGFYKDADAEKVVLIFTGKVDDEVTFEPIGDNIEDIVGAEWLAVENVISGGVDLRQHNRDIVARCLAEMKDA
jgi:ADP-ribose pyrophosphatase YjhB (NUDIX family)